MKRLFLFVIMMAVFSAAGPLSAGNLENKDNKVTKVTVDHGHDIVVNFLMRPGYKYKFVCAHCTITVNGSQVEVGETDEAVIQGGQVSLVE